MKITMKQLPRKERKNKNKKNTQPMKKGKKREKKRVTPTSFVSGVAAHELVRRNAVLRRHEFGDGFGVAEEDLHANKGFPPFLRQHVPGLGAGQQVADGALRQPQHALAKQALADGVLAQRLLHLLHKLLRVAAQLFLRCNATLGYGCVRASLKRVRNCGTYSGDWGPILKRGRNCGTTLGTVVLS